MPASPSDMIVHQYKGAPAFSVKARLMLGLKNARWFACDHPTILPKPDLAALTGGYRQIPVLQIGADIYCGTELIADELDKRIDGPPLASLSGEGIGRGIAHWAEDNLFWLTVQIVCASDFEYAEDPDFNADRRKMLPGIWDPETMKVALPENVMLLRGHLDLMERQLAGGRAFMLGESADLADISLYFPLHFMAFCRNGNERITDEYPAVRAWMDRVAAIGHGQRMEEISRADALAIAKAATPSFAPASSVKDGPQPGDRVRVNWAAYSPVALVGELVETHARKIAVRHNAAEVGDVIVHLPRNVASSIEAV